MFTRNTDNIDEAVDRILDPLKRASLISSLEKKLPMQRFGAILGFGALMIFMILDIVDHDVESQSLPFMFVFVILCAANYSATTNKLIQLKLEDARQAQEQ